MYGDGSESDTDLPFFGEGVLIQLGNVAEYVIKGVSVGMSVDLGRIINVGGRREDMAETGVEIQYPYTTRRRSW